MRRGERRGKARRRCTQKKMQKTDQRCNFIFALPVPRMRLISSVLTEKAILAKGLESNQLGSSSLTGAAGCRSGKVHAVSTAARQRLKSPGHAPVMLHAARQKYRADFSRLSVCTPAGQLFWTPLLCPLSSWKGHDCYTEGYRRARMAGRSNATAMSAAPTIAAAKRRKSRAWQCEIDFSDPDPVSIFDASVCEKCQC